MVDEKREARHLVGKSIVTKEGKAIGEVKDITFETRTGELIQLCIKNPTPHTATLKLESDENNNLLIPYNAITAIGDFVVVAEEDIA